MVHVEVNKADDGNQNTDEVSFSSPLASLSPHEVFGDDDSSELIPLELEPGCLVDHSVDETSGADDVDQDGEDEPDDLVQKERVEHLHERKQSREDDHSDDVLQHDLRESKLDLHISSQVVVQEVDLFLGIVDLRLLDEPNILLVEEAFKFGVSLEVHGRHSEEGDSHEIVALVNLLDLLILGEVKGSEENLLFL